MDTNDDVEIQVSEAEIVVYLNASFENISSLEGIQSFINIEYLTIYHNQVSSLDMSQNPALETLRCGNNQLSSLDITQNLNLQTLLIDSNLLSSIDVTQNLNLKVFTFSDNQLNNLDLSQHMSLEYLVGNNNQLTSLYINNGNNHNMLSMFSRENENLTCIQVDDQNATYPECEGFPIEGWCKDPWTEYSEDCSLGVNDITENKVSLYPNPTRDIINISSQYPINKIKVFDTLGRLVLEGNNPSTQIDVSSLSTGLLFVQIETNEGSLVKKIIKE